MNTTLDNLNSNISAISGNDVDTTYDDYRYSEDYINKHTKIEYIQFLKQKYPEDEKLWKDPDFIELFDVAFTQRYIKPVDDDTLYLDVKKGYMVGKLKIVVICPTCNISATTIETCNLMTGDANNVKCFMCRTYEKVYNYLFNSSK